MSDVFQEIVENPPDLKAPGGPRERTAAGRPHHRIHMGVLRRAVESNFFVDQSVREALIEFFALRNLKTVNAANKILCLLAPRGMGKVSLVLSLCSALSWPLVRISIGTMRNGEGAVLGYRRSDLNAIAGRIVHALGGRAPDNSVVLLENLDKVDTTGMRNPSVDFLEVLSYTQDYAIKNRYQASAVDFSEITFVATASNLSTVPSGLLDQLMVIPIPSYSEREKMKIARGFIIPRLCRDFGLGDHVAISDNALSGVIRQYTREAGIAEMERNLGVIFKRASVRFNERGGDHKIRVCRNHLPFYLGPAKVDGYMEAGKDEAGIVRVLGRSEKGGCLLVLEMLALPGEGQLIFTGNTDKIFQESAMVARDYVRTCVAEYGIQENFHKTRDLHLHMLKGSAPKYGVSAGLAIVTGLVSALSKKPVRGDVAMTGEISLHGRVLGVREIRDKVMGAWQAGIGTVFLPGENEPDLKQIPKEVRRGITIRLADRVETVLREAILWSG